MEAGKRTVKKTLKIYNQDHLDLENAKYISCLRPMSGDDVPIIGNRGRREYRYRLGTVNPGAPGLGFSLV